ncbi:MAG: hypothetical protein PWQ67_1758 [Clostridia bacterium]|jgi:hypothetical protein|nr:hypothetical protein [Clostridia bacterium]
MVIQPIDGNKKTEQAQFFRLRFHFARLRLESFYKNLYFQIFTNGNNTS